MKCSLLRPASWLPREAISGSLLFQSLKVFAQPSARDSQLLPHGFTDFICLISCPVRKRKARSPLPNLLLF